VFQSTSYKWLVVSGKDKAKFKGKGKMYGALFDGSESFKFMVMAQDKGTGKVGTVPNTFHIKIWRDNVDATVIYDNQMGAGEEVYDGTAIGGGNIVIRSS